MATSSIALTTLTATIARAIGLDPAARARIERAATLIALGAVDRIDDATFAVTSQTNGILVYTVTPNGCDCVDAQRHRDQWCKHQWAARILLSAERQEVRQRFALLSDDERARLAEVKQRVAARRAV